MNEYEQIEELLEKCDAVVRRAKRAVHKEKQWREAALKALQEAKSIVQEAQMMADKLK